MLYREIEVIEQVKDKGDRVRLILLFIRQYSEYLNKLNNTGLQWGADGEEIGANQEAVKCQKHINVLEDMILKECGVVK
ncbi:MAG: hypothetical protein WCS27_06400 [Victivallaceae bacterium]|jgi:hypothetical protein